MKKFKLPVRSEHEEQVALFDWAALMERQYPELKRLYAVVNAGKRSLRMGAWYKAEGLKKGILDVELPVARGGYHGLYIEMKIKGTKPTEEQKWWLDSHKENGYAAYLCYSCAEAIGVIENYIKGGMVKTPKVEKSQVQCTGGLKPGCHEDCQHREAHEVYRTCKGCEAHICPNAGAKVKCEPVKRPMGVK